MKTLSFGPYMIEVDADHAVIYREDGEWFTPTFYELQHIKCLAFGGDQWAIEVFPAARDLVDGQQQRHLWRVDRNLVPNLVTGDWFAGLRPNLRVISREERSENESGAE